jgi:hypothetical protein
MNVEPEKIQALISILQSMLVPSEQSNDALEDDKPVKTKKSTNKKQTSNKKQNNNKFDSMPEMRMHKEDITVDKKLAIHPPVPRARPFELITVQCRVCGKKENINPVLLTDYERHKCNKCSSTAG